MDGLLRCRLLIFLTLLCGVLCADPARAAEVDNGLARSLLDDAALHDVMFVDAAHGWAVGDRGVIWRTDDGGQTWQLAQSPVNCTLRSVHFRDTENGWAAGGEQRPYLNSSRGVLLRTMDGGRTWERDPGLLLPTIREIKFFNGSQGWALTEPSALFPSGIFYTDNDGRSWTPLPEREPADWTLADFADPVSAALAGPRGMRGAVTQRRLEPWQQTEFGLREVRALRLLDAKAGWIVGDGGLLLHTRDGGRSWEPAAQEPTSVEQFDLRTVEVHGPHVWIAGAPGTQIMHSPDGGSTWEGAATGQNVPLHRLTFVDGQHGWAVGALGVILATHDGGRTWQRQQGARQRAALLAIYSDADRVPLEILARLAGNEGYITAVELLARRDAEPDTTPVAAQMDRASTAFVGVGCSATEWAWGFPLRQPGIQRNVEQLTDGWNRLYTGQGIERLEEHLVRRIRLWRPEVVLTSAAAPAGDDPLGHLVNQLVLRAIDDAASSDKFAEQLSVGGLTTWTVKKVAGTLPLGKLGTINLNTAQLAPRLARSLSDYAGASRGMLAARYTAPPVAWGVRLYADALPQGVGQQDFFSGLTVAAPSEARRELPPAGRAGMDAMRQIAEKHRNLQAILNHTERSGRGGAILLGQLGELTRGLDPETAGQALFELAETYYTDGHWDLAAATFQSLVEKYPGHALTKPSLVWLVQYFASGEAACRARSNTAVAGHKVTPTADAAALIPVAPAATTATGGIPPASQARLSPVVQASAQQALSPTTADASLRENRAAEFAQMLERLDAQAWADLHVQFPLAATRTRRQSPEANRFVTAVANSRPHDAWWACASGEQWLVDGAGPSPKTTAHVRRATARPRLDGNLEDDVWQGAERLEITSPLRDDSDWPGTVMLAYDKEFLYLAIHCRCAPQADYPAEDRPRGRDADLSNYDHVMLSLDIDRDWTTFYQFRVDHRGWTAEECWGDKSWNPQWYVASNLDNQGWTIEAAIPLAELTTETVGPKTVWALGLQRLVPGVGLQSWTRPATAEFTPYGCGYFLFE